MATEIVSSNRWVSFGRWVKERREALGLTQSAAGLAAGMVRQQWNRIEQAKSGTKYDSVIRIAQVLKVDQAEALDRAGYAPPQTHKPTPAVEPDTDKTTIKEMLTRLDFDLQVVKEKVEQVGYIDSQEETLITLVGQAGAGKPLETFLEGEPLSVKSYLTAPGKINLGVEVVGNSMIDDCVIDGDILICHMLDGYKSVKNGSAVVVDIENDGAVYKRWSNVILGAVTLSPRNKNDRSFVPKTYNLNRIRAIYGVTGLMRKM